MKTYTNVETYYFSEFRGGSLLYFDIMDLSPRLLKTNWSSMRIMSHLETFLFSFQLRYLLSLLSRISLVL